MGLHVIPLQAGNQCRNLDSRLRGNDGTRKSDVDDALPDRRHTVTRLCLKPEKCRFVRIQERPSSMKLKKMHWGVLCSSAVLVCACLIQSGCGEAEVSRRQSNETGTDTASGPAVPMSDMSVLEKESRPEPVHVSEELNRSASAPSAAAGDKNRSSRELPAEESASSLEKERHPAMISEDQRDSLGKYPVALDAPESGQDLYFGDPATESESDQDGDGIPGYHSERIAIGGGGGGFGGGFGGSYGGRQESSFDKNREAGVGAALICSPAKSCGSSRKEPATSPQRNRQRTARDVVL